MMVIKYFQLQTKLFFIICIALCCNISFSFLITSYQIKDLETNRNFTSDVKAWKYSSLLPETKDPVSHCNNEILLGGYNKLANSTDGTYLQREYKDLPEHNIIYFSFDIWIIDSWDTNDEIYLYFDSFKFRVFNINSFNPSSLYLCGSAGWVDVGKLNVVGSVVHNKSSLVLNLTAKNDESPDNESFGAGKISLLFGSSNTTVNKMCHGPVSSVHLSNVECDCPIGQYNSSISKTCSVCHSSCKSCFGPTEKDCFECKEGYVYNGNLCSFCGDSCTVCNNTKRGGILDIGDVCKECTEMITEYLGPLSNGYRYTIRLLPSICDLNESTVQKNLQVNPRAGSFFPSRSLEVIKLDRNLYEVDLVLKDSLAQKTDLNLTLFYLEGTLTVPKTFMPSPTLLKISEQVPTVQIVLISTMGASLGGTLALGATGALWSIISFQQFIKYFRYINVEYPFQTELFFSLPQAVNWSALPNPLSSSKSVPSNEERELYKYLSQEYPPPQKFVKYGDSSFFVENGATTILTNLALLTLLIIILIIRKIPKLKNNSILRSLKIHLRWNIIARTFLKNGIPLSLAIFLQFRAFRFDHSYLIKSSLLAIFSFIFLIFMIIFFLRALMIRNNTHLNKKFVRKLLGTLYQRMVLGNTLGKYYHFLIFFRGVLITFVISFFERIPLFQICLLICYNIGFVYFLFVKASFLDSKLNKINRIKEVLILASEICIFGLYFETNSLLYYDLLGWLIVGTLGSALMIELVYILGLQIINLGVIVSIVIGKCRMMKDCFKKQKIDSNKVVRADVRMQIKTIGNNEAY